MSDAEAPPNHPQLVPAPPITTSHPSNVGTYSFAIPLNNIYSLNIRPPNMGWWFGSIVVNTRAGESFPALFFHDNECQSTMNQRKKLARESFDPFGDKGGMFWGGDEILRWFKRYTVLERSAESNVYLVDPSADDKRGFGKPTPDKVAKALEGPGHQSQKSREDPVAKAFKEARWSFLEKLAQVTTFTRRTAQAVVENPRLPPQVRRLMQNPDVQTVQDEFDSARVYLARWAMTIAEQSEKERSQRMWSAKDVLQMEDSELGEFEILDMEANNLTLGDRRKVVRLKEWEGFFESKTGKLQLTPDEVKERVFHGGLDPDDGVRKEAWLFLLGVYEWDSTSDERHAKINSLRDEYLRLKAAWWDRLMDEAGTLEEREWWKEQKMRIGMSRFHTNPKAREYLADMSHFLGFAM